MGRPANRDFGSRQRVRVINRDYEHYPMAAETQGPRHVQVTGAGETEVVVDPDVGLYLVITSLWLSNAASTELRVLVRDGTGGTVGFGGTLAGGGGGVAMRFTPPWQLSEGSALIVDTGAEGSANVDVNVNFFVE